MKTVVLLNELHPSDLISKEIYREYINLLEKDIRSFFLSGVELKEVACPGCGSKEQRFTYEKWGLSFVECMDCSSIFVNPRPSEKELNRFYKDSESCRFWRKETVGMGDSQLYYIYGPKADWISFQVDEFIKDPELLIDYHAKYPYLLNSIQKTHLFRNIGVIASQWYESPGTLPENLLDEREVCDHRGQVSVMTAFEALERMYDPSQLFKTASDYIKPGGLLLLTTASCTGFEYQILGRYAPNINPINRMNLLSMRALGDMVEQAGFEIVEFSTPGRLDVEIVREALKNNQKINVHPFWRNIFESRDEKTWQNLQGFLQENRLSSHVRIAAKKL